MKFVAICPFCAAEVEQLTRKDEESFATTEIRAHYETAHPDELAAWKSEHGALFMPYAMEEVRD